MKKTADFIVERRFWILAVVLILTGVFGMMIPKVKVITDMTEYLADDSSMKIGMDIMDEEFPDAQEDYTIRVMFRGLTEEEKLSMRQRLAGIRYVTKVDYKPGDAGFNSGDHVKYVLHTDYDYESSEEKSVEASLRSDFSENDMQFANDSGDHPNIPTYVMVGLVAILLVILIIMCSSWIEPFLFLFTIGIAVVLNFGTNIMLGSIAETTFSVTAMLQLVLSMDYSIILSNRYRQELTNTDDRKAAMKAAVAGAFSSIFSSSFTTVVGLLALVFMKFKIGPNMGVVLAKGVFLSVVCVFLILPGLLIMCSGLMEKTKKSSPKIPTGGLARFCYKYRIALASAFLLLFAGVLYLQSRTTVSYAAISNDAVADVFPKDKTVVVLYDNRDDARMTALASEMEQWDGVKSASNYSNTLGRQYTSAEILDAIDDLSESMGNDNSREIAATESMFNMLYFLYRGNTPGTMTLGEFLQFLSQDVMTDPAFAPYLAGVDAQAFAPLTAQPSGDLLTTPMSTEEMAALLGNMSAGFDANTVKMMYLYHDANLPSAGNGTMSIEQLMNFLNDAVVQDPTFAMFLDEEMVSDIRQWANDLNDGIRQLKGPNYSRLILSVTISEEGSETDGFYRALNDRCEDNVGRYFFIGSSAMNYEMSQTFHDELTLITVLTAVAIFLVVLITFRSPLVPLVLVLLVQCGVYITITVIGFQGYSINYLALLIVQCILMGSMIDYGILFSNYYRDARRSESVPEALKKAYEGSIHTILTSGLIIVIVTAVFGQCFGEPTVEQICRTISMGAASAILLILFILPGVLACLDRFTAGRGSLRTNK
ncbi:MAG: MMPL family transporter [Lachnospiraceae bacterium]|nr:MMPL family transporter [Lachnospiraceae bacterium]